MNRFARRISRVQVRANRPTALERTRGHIFERSRMVDRARLLHTAGTIPLFARNGSGRVDPADVSPPSEIPSLAKIHRVDEANETTYLFHPFSSNRARNDR